MEAQDGVPLFALHQEDLLNIHNETSYCSLTFQPFSSPHADRKR